MTCVIYPDLPSVVRSSFAFEVELSVAARGFLLVNHVLCGSAAYRTQLFVYLKSYGRAELRELLDERIESHKASAAWWRREAARRPEEQTDAEPLLPEEMCKNEAERHEWRVDVLAFVRSHTDQEDEYRLGASDLEFGELLPPQPSSVEQNGFEECNRLGFSLERIAKEMGRRHRWSPADCARQPGVSGRSKAVGPNGGPAAHRLCESSDAQRSGRPTIAAKCRKSRSRVTRGVD